MDPNLVYVKTAAGEAALQNRALLPRQDMRAVLIMIDGKNTVSQLLYKIGHMYPVEVVLMRLEADGLIQTSLAADSIWAQADEVAEEIRSLAARHPPRQVTVAASALKDDSTVSTVHFPVEKSDDIPKPSRKRRRKKSKRSSPPMQSFLRFLPQVFLRPLAALFASEPPVPRKKRSRATVFSFGVVCGCLSLPVLLFIVAIFFPYGTQIQRFESALSETLQQPVRMNGVSLKLTPYLHFALDSVRVGETLKVDSVRFAPEILPLFLFQLNFSTLSLDGLTLDNSTLSGFTAALSNLERNTVTDTEKTLDLSRVSVSFPAVTLTDLEGKAVLSPGKKMPLVTLNSGKQNLKFSLLSDNNDAVVELSGSQLKIPDLPYRIDTLSFRGTLRPDSIVFDSIRVVTLDGTLEGTLTVPNGKNPELTGEASFKEARMSKLGKVFGYANQFEGMSSGHLSFTTSGNSWQTLLDNLAGSGDFDWPQGRLEKFDFGSVPRNKSNIIMPGIPTRFAQMKGNMQITSRALYLEDIVLSSGPISVEGNVTIDRDGPLDGKLSVSLHAVQDNIIDIPISLSGTLSRPLIHK